MIFTSSSQNFPSIEIRNNPLVKVTESKFLGVIIDNRLSFKAHVNKLCKKVSSAIGAIKRVRFFIPKSIIKTLYFSLVPPHLLYGICVWGSSGVGNINRISGLQKRAFRLFPDHEDSEFFIRNRILNFEKMFAFCVSLKFHKYLNSTANPEIKSFIEELRPQHGHQTRFVVQGNINLPYCHSSKFQQSFIFESIGIWNKIPSEVRGINSANIFKNRLKKYLILNRL